MRRQIFIYAVLLSVGLAALWAGPQARPAQAQAGWSAPFDVSDNQAGWWPDIAADADGALHVIWGVNAVSAPVGEQSSEALRDLLNYRVLRGGVWSAVNTIASTCVGGYTVRNSIVANADGRLNVLVRTCTSVKTFDAPSDQAWSAQAWSPLQTIGASYYNALAADSKGTLHAIYNENLFGRAEGTALLSDVFYRRSTDGGRSWSLRTNLARMRGGDERPQIKVDALDRVHVVWDHGSDWYIAVDNPQHGVYRRSDDGGETWRDPVLLGTADGPVVQITLGISREGNPLVVYRSANDSLLYYQTSPDGGETWTVAQPIPQVRARVVNERGLDSYVMATDGASRIHLLATGFPDGSMAGIPMLLHLTWDGQAWSLPEVVSATKNRPMWPRLVAAGNQLHAVWFSYTDASGWGERRIWYSARTLDGPALPAPPRIARPAQAAASEPEATANPLAGAEPLPTAGPAAELHFRSTPPPGGPVDTPIALIAALALVPVLGLILIIALLIVWKRRLEP